MLKLHNPSNFSELSVKEPIEPKKNAKKKLLFINQKQYGYHVNFAQYCKHLKNEFDIIYLSWDYGKNRISEDGVDIKYICRDGSIIQRNIRFFKKIFKQIDAQSYHCIFINYFRGCFIIPFIYRRKYWIHLNIVTGNVSSKSISRKLNNFLLRCESYFFKSVSILSEGLQKLLKISRKAYILPLGAEPMILKRQLEHKISLLYIGVFSRRIDDTIAGFGMFMKKHPDADIRYTIIGEGWGNEMEQIREQIEKYKLDKYVELKGYIPHNQLKKYYEKSNVGISYIPITPWYEYQPSTKTFEYLMAGMPVIATGTYENKKVINEQSGIIINDDPESFADSLELLYDKIDDFDEDFIRESVAENNWVTIASKLKEFIRNRP